MGKLRMHSRLTNSRFCVFYVKMNHIEAHLIMLMVSLRVVDSKVPVGLLSSGRPFSFSVFFFLLKKAKC